MYEKRHANRSVTCAPTPINYVMANRRYNALSVGFDGLYFLHVTSQALYKDGQYDNNLVEFGVKKCKDRKSKAYNIIYTGVFPLILLKIIVIVGPQKHFIINIFN